MDMSDARLTNWHFAGIITRYISVLFIRGRSTVNAAKVHRVAKAEGKEKRGTCYSEMLHHVDRLQLDRHAEAAHRRRYIDT